MTEDICDLLCLDLPAAERVRSGLPDPDAASAASNLAKALADPNRVRVAAALSGAAELCVCDLAWVCSLAQNLVSHHVRLLRAAGLASSRRDGRMVMYALTPVGHAFLAAVMPTPAASDDLPTASQVGARSASLGGLHG